jgi:hexulose-6-phosphate isomerase
MSHLDRGEVIQAQKETGLAISSVCDARHWKFMLSDPDPEVRQQGIEALKLALEDAAAYGTDTVLLVPGRVDETVAYDVCWDRTVEGIRKALPLAEKLKVNIAIENVWNNFLLSPLEAARYVDQFESPCVRFYFDCGNVLQCYGWPDQWIRLLGERIARIHIKDYSLSIARDQGIRPGYRVRLLEGEVDWSAVMKALGEIGYQGWTTVETGLGGKDLEGLIDYRERLEKILSS